MAALRQTASRILPVCPAGPADPPAAAVCSLADWLTDRLLPGWQSGVTVDLCCLAAAVTHGGHAGRPVGGQ